MASPVVESAISIAVEGVRYAVADRCILDGLDLTVSRGSTVAVTGPSGSGKTTLLLMMAGILQPHGGRVKIGGVELTSLGSSQRAATRLREVGVVYQFGELLPELTPIENVVLPALMARVPRDRAYGRARDLLMDLGVGALATSVTGTLSGGERQRVAVARALVTEPALVLADEPTGALDRESAEVVSDMLYQLPARHDCAVVVVTHSDRIARKADRWLELENGRLVEADR